MDGDKIKLKNLIQTAGEQLKKEFEEIGQNNPHAAESGAEVEIILKNFLKDRLPKRFDIESGIVVGSDGSISRQTDLIIFDTLNSPIYRKGPKVYILPRDNVAAVVEVKSKLNKKQLRDAAEKISSVKKIKPSPITNIDQPVTFSKIITTNTLGCVFAFDSYTSLDRLAENLREINDENDSSNWIDLVVVLNKGFIAYSVQLPLEQSFRGSFGGTCGEDFSIPPYYIHLIKKDAGELTLNHFFVKLMAHLTFFRRRSAIDFESVLDPGSSQSTTTIQGYQYNLKKKLVPVEEFHKEGKYRNPKVRFNLYFKNNSEFVGQVCLLPWQDGAVITCSSRFNHKIIFQHYFESLKLHGIILPASEKYNIWYSSVLPISEDEFIKYSDKIHAELIVVRDSDDDNPLKP